MTQPHYTGVERHLHREDLVGKVIDAHSHIGVALREARRSTSPTAPALRTWPTGRRPTALTSAWSFRSPALYYDLRPSSKPESCGLPRNRSRRALRPRERMLLTESTGSARSTASRFLPFISVDPGRLIDEQIASLEELEQEFPIYGVKIHPLMAQSKALALLDVGAPLLEFFASGLAGPLPRDARSRPIRSHRQPTSCRSPNAIRSCVLPGPLHRLPPRFPSAGRGAAQHVG